MQQIWHRIWNVKSEKRNNEANGVRRPHTKLQLFYEYIAPSGKIFDFYFLAKVRGCLRLIVIKY